MVDSEYVRKLRSQHHCRRKCAAGGLVSDELGGKAVCQGGRASRRNRASARREQSAQGGTRPTEDQGEQTCPRAVFGKGTPGVQTPSQRQQAGQDQDRSGGGGEGGSGTPTSRCPIQRLRRSHRAG